MRTNLEYNSWRTNLDYKYGITFEILSAEASKSPIELSLSHSPQTGPPTIAVRVSVMTIGGRGLASRDADGTRTKIDMCVRIPGLV